MKQQELQELLSRLRQGKVSVNKVLAALTQTDLSTLPFAQLDLQRQKRRGFPETVLCEGKTLEQAACLLDKIYQYHGVALGTRASPELFDHLKEHHPKAYYNQLGRIIRLGPLPRRRSGFVGIITAGTSDIPVAEEATEVIKVRGARVKSFYDIGVAGLHRIIAILPQLRRCRVLIVIAGMDGALPSVVAGLLDRPVIAVPTSTGYGAAFSGVTALLGMLNSCAEGVGVVNIDNGFGAACLAVMISNNKS